MEHNPSKDVVLITITDQEHETDSTYCSLTEIQRKYPSQTQQLNVKCPI